MVGLQIRQRQRAVSLALAQKFLTVPVANVSDCMSRLFGGGADLRPMHRGDPMSGPAFTVKVRPGDNLMIHKALEMAMPGDVIVVDGGGDLTNALVGEIMTSVGRHRKLAGMVIYGAVRDAAALKESDFPVFAAGVTHRGPYKDGPGEINTSIAINGMVIEPDDLMIGDDDGFLCVPYDQAEALYAAAIAKGALEATLMKQIRSGVADGANMYENGRFENVVSGARSRVCEAGAQRWVDGSSKAALSRRRRLQEARRKPFERFLRKKTEHPKDQFLHALSNRP